MTTAKVRIEGEDATGAAWLSAIERAKGASEQMSRLFEASIAGISFAGVFEAGKGALEYGAQVERASETTRMSTRAVQELGYAAQQLAGVDMPTVVTAITFMQKALNEAASGMGEQKKALDALGLSYSEIKNLSPDQQFETIGERISELRDPTDRARAAADLLGRSWQQLGPLFADGAEGIDKFRKEADALGIALSDAQIKRLDEADKAVDRLSTTFGRLFATLAAGLASHLTPIMTELTGFAGGDKLMTLQGELAQAQEWQRAGGGPYYARRVKELEAEIAQLQKAPPAGSSDALGEVGVSVSKLRKPPPGFQSSELAGVDDVRVTAQKVQTDAMNKLFDQWESDTRTGLEKQIDVFTRKADELEELVGTQRVSRGEYLGRVGEALSGLPTMGEEANQLDELSGRHSISVGEHLQLLTGQLTNQMSDNAQMPDLTGEFGKETDKMQAIAEQAGRNMQNAFAKFLFDPFKGGVRGMAIEFLQAMQKMLANEAAEKLFGALGDWGSSKSGAGGITGAIAGFVGGMFGGGKAGGGDVSGGTSYLVGEDGPEIFTPSAHGIITPNAAIGGNVTVQMGDTHIHAGGSNASDLARVLPGILEAHRAQTKAEMLNAFRRSGLPAPNRA